MLLYTVLVIQTLYLAFFLASVYTVLSTSDISRRWIDPVMSYVGLPHPNPASTELSDSLIQGVVTVTQHSALEPMSLVTVLTTYSPPNEPDDMDVPADDTPSQGIIRQPLEPTVSVVEVTPAGTTPVDGALRPVSAHPQAARFPARVARAGSRLWSSSFLDSSAPVSPFTTIIAVFISFAMGVFTRSVTSAVPDQLAL